MNMTLTCPTPPHPSTYYEHDVNMPHPTPPLAETWGPEGIYIYIIHVLHIHDYTYTWVTFHSYVKLPEGKSLLSGINRISIKCHLSRNRQEESRGMGSTLIPLYIIRTKTKTNRFCSWYNSGMKKICQPAGVQPAYQVPYAV